MQELIYAQKLLILENLWNNLQIFLALLHFLHKDTYSFGKLDLTVGFGFFWGGESLSFGFTQAGAVKRCSLSRMITTTRSAWRGIETYSKFLFRKDEGVCTKCCIITVWANKHKGICLHPFILQFLSHSSHFPRFPLITSALHRHFEHGSQVFSEALK